MLLTLTPFLVTCDIFIATLVTQVIYWVGSLSNRTLRPGIGSEIRPNLDKSEGFSLLIAAIDTMA